LKGKRPDNAGKAAAETVAADVAARLALELVEVALSKEPQGMTLCITVDKPGGVTLDDCERFHRTVQPLLEAVDYDFLEVSSPGADRPVETPRDVEKRLGALVEVRLYAPVDGVKRFEGTLRAMDGANVTIGLPDGGERSFPRKAVALVKPVIVFDETE
jgi:ribosome maturation factor RimP